MKKANTPTMDAWKKFFTANLNGLDAASSWKDIILALKLSPEDFFILHENTQKTIGQPSTEEVDFYLSLPYYEDALMALEHVKPKMSGFLFDPSGNNNYMVCFNTSTTQAVNLLEVVIVTNEDVDPNLDMAFFYFGDELADCINVRYAKRIPTECLDKMKPFFATMSSTSIH